MFTRGSNETQPTTNQPTGRLYRAAARCDDWHGSSQCALGISIGNPQGRGEALGACLDWVARNFDRGTIVIGDSLHRLTLTAAGLLRPKEAHDEAIRIGREYRRSTEQWIPAGQRRFSVLLTSTLTRISRFQSMHDKLRDLFETDGHFAASLQSDAADYLDRPDRQFGPRILSRSDRLAVCCSYLLEDLAVCATLPGELNLRVLAYPGAPPKTLTALTRGEFQHTPREFIDFVFVPLRLRSRSNQRNGITS